MENRKRPIAKRIWFSEDEWSKVCLLYTSEPDALSDTGMSDDVGAGDTSGILHDSAGGTKNTITGTNTPRSSRASAYDDWLRSQHKNGHYKACLLYTSRCV